MCIIYRYNYDFFDTAYVEGVPGEFEVGACNIREIHKKYNSVKAHIDAESDSYIVFSQNYFPGWNAYIDGEKVQVNVVNGVLQGISVPKGEHTVIFKYEPAVILIGFVITASGVLICIILLFFAKCSRKFAAYY